MLKQPVHRDLGAVVARREERTLGADLRETHAGELVHRLGVELRLRWCVCSDEHGELRATNRPRKPARTLLIRRELVLALLQALADERAHIEVGERHNDGNVDLARHPAVELEAGGVDKEDIREGGEARGSGEES